jgi:DHA2 family methylenomycin A resistance protein-like MFS transporter
MATATVLIAGLVFALIEAPSVGWLRPAVVSAVVLALAGLVGFVWIEWSVQAPLLPIGAYGNRAFTGSALQGGLFNFAFYGVLFAMSLMLQQGRGLSALTSGFLFLPLTALISIGTICSAPLAQRLGRPAVLAVGQIILAVSLVAVAVASTAHALWPLIVALIPAGFSSGMLVPTMTSQTLAAVEPALHGAASAVFNTSRQLGGAIGVATFGPLLGAAHGLRTGFVTCLLVAAASVAIALLLTALTQRRALT